MITAQNTKQQDTKGANIMEVTYRMQDGFQVPNLLMPQTYRRCIWASTRSCGERT